MKRIVKIDRGSASQLTRRRVRLWDEAGGLCFYCNKPTRLIKVRFGPMPEDAATVDHYVPLNPRDEDKGIASVLRMVTQTPYVLSCARCNRHKGNKLTWHP